MKISTFLLIMVALQFSVMIFNSSQTYQTPIFDFVQNPLDWSNTVMLLFVSGILAGIVLAGSYVGSLIFGKTDLMVFSSTALVFIGSAVPIASLWSLIYSQVGFFGTTSTSSLIASIITAPFLILAVVTILNWWRSGDIAG